MQYCCCLFGKKKSGVPSPTGYENIQLLNWKFANMNDISDSHFNTLQNEFHISTVMKLIYSIGTGWAYSSRAKRGDEMRIISANSLLGNDADSITCGFPFLYYVCSLHTMPLYFEFMMTQTVINQDWLNAGVILFNNVKDTTAYMYLIIQMS